MNERVQKLLKVCFLNFLSTNKCIAFENDAFPEVIIFFIVFQRYTSKSLC